MFYNVPHRRIDYMTTNRGLKNRTAISTAVDKELYKRLKEYSDKTSIPISKLIDKAVCMFLETVDK